MAANLNNEKLSSTTVWGPYQSVNTSFSPPKFLLDTSFRKGSGSTSEALFVRPCPIEFRRKLNTLEVHAYYGGYYFAGKTCNGSLQGALQGAETFFYL
jgi:hypothetical protein